MILAVDIGNTNITIAIWNGKNWGSIYHITTSKKINHAICFSVYNSVVSEVNKSDITIVIISSVVPKLTLDIKNIIATNLECPILLVHTSMKSPLSQEIPQELGQDLFANAVAAYSKSNSVISSEIESMASIVVDMGTALTFTAIRGNGTIAGVAISTGIETSYRALVEKTAQISTLPLEMPQSALGLTTQESLNSGLMLGFRYLITGMLAKIKEELQEPCKVYATGGLHKTMSSLAPPHTTIFDEINIYHTLDGLKILAQWNM